MASKPDKPSAAKKQDLSKLVDILKNMTNNDEEGKTLCNQSSAISTTAGIPPTGELTFFEAVHL